MKAPTLVGIVVALHVLAVGAFVFIQGCGTTPSRTPTVEAPPPPVMPPKAKTATTGGSRSILKPPVKVDADRMPGQGDVITHVVKKGETLGHIGKQYGISSRELAGLNNLANPNSLSVGQKILVPAYAAAGGSRPVSTPKPAAVPAPARPKIDLSQASQVYVVQSGDSLSRIAVKYGTSVQALREANGLTNDQILVGQKLAIPDDASKTPSPATSVAAVGRMESAAPAPKEVEVRPPESRPSEPVSLMSIDEDAAADDVEDAMAVGAEKPIIYTVVQGDNIDEIAKLFIVSKQDILEINSLDPDAELEPGQKIKIPPSAL